MFMIVGNFLYISPSLGDPGTIEWDTTRLHWVGESLSVINGQDTCYDVGTHDFLYLKSSELDSIDIGGTRYGFSSEMQNISNDTVIDLLSNYAGSTDTVANYTVYKYIDYVSEYPTMVENNGILYIVYNGIYYGSVISYRSDTSWQFMAVLDTGKVTSAVDLDTSSFVATGDNVRLRSGTNTAFNLDTGVWDTAGIAVGDMFFYYYKYQCLRSHDRRGGGSIQDGTFYSKITEIDTAGIDDYIELEYTFETPCGGATQPITESNSWEIRREATVTPIDSNMVGLADSSKNWNDINFSNGLYTSFYAVSSDSGYDAIWNIFENGDTILVIDGTIVAGDYYYIMSGIPTYLLRNAVAEDSLFKEFPRFKQMLFYGGQFYSIGTYYGKRENEPAGYPNPFGDEYEGHGDRIWYSHPGYPGYIRYDYFFTLDKGEVATLLFVIRDNLYISTSNGIWRSVGVPAVKGDRGSQTLTKVVSNNGIPDINNWAKATEEYGYFTNRTGIYRFDGIRPEKISWAVDPIIEQNYESRIVMVYQNPDLYISFTDSNFTLVYDERFNAFTKLDFGMTCAYAPSDTNIIYFGLNGQTGRVYYYPNGEYWDRNSPTDSSAIDITYESGWQSLTDGPWVSKKLNSIYLPVRSDTSFHFDIFTDFDTVASDTFTSATYTQKAYRIDELNAVGDYFKTKITATVIDTMIIRPYRLTWSEQDMKEGD